MVPSRLLRSCATSAANRPSASSRFIRRDDECPWATVLDKLAGEDFLRLGVAVHERDLADRALLAARGHVLEQVLLIGVRREAVQHHHVGAPLALDTEDAHARLLF